jgi:hypothetical protein
VAALSGTTWQYVGPTTTVPTSAVVPRAAAASYPPVVIGWTDGTQSDMLRGQAKSVLGMTRTAWFGVQTPDGRKHAATRAAVIALDRTDSLPLRGATSWQAVVLHELGHAMGLAHVERPQPADGRPCCRRPGPAGRRRRPGGRPRRRLRRARGVGCLVRLAENGGQGMAGQSADGCGCSRVRSSRSTARDGGTHLGTVSSSCSASHSGPSSWARRPDSTSTASS